jgi:hypothetical protein
MPEWRNASPKSAFIRSNNVPSSPDSFHRLKDSLAPTAEQRARMFARVREGMTTAKDLRSVRAALEPDAGAQIRIWNRVSERIAPSRARGFLDQVRAYLTPDQPTIHLGRGLFPALQPVAVPSRPFKWVAAFALVLVAVRVSPLLFLAPQTIAQSSVLLRPTRGLVTVSLDGLSQPVDHEIELLQSIAIHTDDGEATVILHDDGTVRLGADTSIILQDLSDRPEKGSGLATLTLASGTVWVQGLVADHLRGLSVSTPEGVVTVHGGSVSVSVIGGETIVEAWDRHARLEREEQADVVLVAGERLNARGSSLAVEQMPDGAYDTPWPSQNLQRDAVHQRAIAQEQRERIAARAGILPTSRLYTVKRIAEEVDVLFTFDHETSVKKRVAQATTRLNEATTLIADGQSGATIQLEEYQVAMLDIAGGSGDTITQRLVEEGMAENVAQLGAQLPNDDVYAVKKLVLETTSKLPSQPINESDVEAAVLGDAVDAIQIAAAEGDDEAVQEGLETLAPYIEDLPGDTGLDAATKKEVISRLTRVADSIQDGASTANGSGSVAMRAVSRVIRTHVPATPPPVHLTQEEIASMVDAILDRVFVYSQYVGQTNQLRQEVIKLKGHPDEGMVLRSLYDALQEYEELNSEGALVPDFRLSLLVRGAIRGLRDAQGAQID